MAARPRVTILGSLNTDISVAVPHLPAPGETILGSDAVIAPGGKGANQAVAAARLGGRAAMAGCTGDDDFGAALTGALAAEGVDVSAVRAVGGKATGMALITIDPAGENVITVAPGANAETGMTEVGAALAGGSELLIISAEIPVPAVALALAGAREAGLPSLLNLAPAPPGPAELLAAGPGWLVVNETEAAAVLGRPVTGMAGALAAAADLRAAGPRNVVVTAGAQGAALAAAGPGTAEPVPGLRVRSVDAVGAGDAFVAALGVALAAGVPAAQAVRAACAAGATATTRRGTQDALPRPAGILAATGIRWPLPG
ncbi:MAG TPA: PfkB family carbohydrate kinase [Streptosporangiaceae bacterium]|jgi:ribokinase